MIYGAIVGMTFIHLEFLIGIFHGDIMEDFIGYDGNGFWQQPW